MKHSNPSMSPKEERRQLWVILLIVFIGFVGTSIAYPIFPPLFLHNTAGSIIPSSWHENMRGIMLGIALAAYPLGQFLGAPILGACSDRYGRKNWLLFSLVGSVLGYLLSALSLQYNWLWVLLLSRLLTGFMEGNIAIVRAMAADLNSISKYTSIGRINGLGAVGYIMGPLLGGFFSDSHTFRWFSFALPFFLATILSILAVFLSFFSLSSKNAILSRPELTLWQRFNFVKGLKLLCYDNDTLKYLLITSTIFTFSVDIFYEFGPVYLTKLWSMTPSGIAVYNASLSLALALGAAWLPPLLSRHFSIKRSIALAMFATTLIFGLISLFPLPILVFFLFGAAGFSISTVTTNMTIHVSDAADKTIQGEAMGAQLGLRTLGDAVICLIGGFLIISSAILPMACSCLIAFFAFIVYLIHFATRSRGLIL